MSTQRWFHPHITGPDAATLLKQCGYDGAFLVRRSKSSPSDFTLCCKQGSEVFHIKIQATEDYFDLYGGDKFATLSELIEHYRQEKAELKERNGTVIHLRHPVLSQDPTSERWFHGQLPGKEAERMLKEKGKDGQYLVRASQSQPGNFVLSIRESAVKITHVQIRCINGRYDVGGGEQFGTLVDLVSHYQEKPMVETTGQVVKMSASFNATRVTAASIQARVAELSKETDQVYGRAGFYDEFEELQQLGALLLYDRKAGQMPENKKKNRYKNILPFDATRVTVRGNPEVLGSDYINANYIDGSPAVPRSKAAYVACQGPLKATVATFWQMIWERNCKIIVMTTEIVERGKNKCHPYWPRIEDGRQPNPDRFGDFLVERVSEKSMPHYTLRKIRVSYQDSRPRDITQFHFLAWPDHGVPKEPSAVLQFLLDVNNHKAQIRDMTPTVVHCSAGIGRTGTFIVIDILLKYIDVKGIDVEIDIQSTIHEARKQRSGMIQTEEQYRFVYQAIAQYISVVQTKGAALGSDTQDLYANLSVTAPRGGAPALPRRGY